MLGRDLNFNGRRAIWDGRILMFDDDAILHDIARGYSRYHGVAVKARRMADTFIHLAQLT